jgi:hypothetical protein
MKVSVGIVNFTKKSFLSSKIQVNVKQNNLVLCESIVEGVADYLFSVKVMQTLHNKQN